MSSNNVKRDWIEIGVYATLAKVYAVVAAILVLNLIAGGVILFFTPSAAILAFSTGISMGLLIFTIVSICTVEADKITRKEAGIIA